MQQAIRVGRALIAALVLAGSAASHATTLTWPGSPGCTGTLQACIYASAASDTIEIATATPVNEDLHLGDHSLSLIAAPYTKPSFVSGRSIEALTSTTAGSVAVTLGKLRLQNGHVLLRYSGTGTATYDVSELDLAQSSSGGAASYIRVQAMTGPVTASLYDNRVSGTPASLNSGLIELAASGASLNAYVAFNHITRADAAGVSGAGILVDVTGVGGTPGGGYMRVFANEVHGVFGRAGVYFSEGLFSSTASSYSASAYNNVVACDSSTVGNGIGFAASSGSISAQALNNTVSACYTGISAVPWDSGSGATISGLVWNNLIVAQYGLEFVPAIASGLANDHNLINAGSNSIALGTHTITAPAKLISAIQPRLAADSPAIDAADSATLGEGLVDNGLPLLDADGLRRLKLGGNDIGAYEYGDLTFVHAAAAANTSGHITYVDNAATNGTGAALLFPTRTTVDDSLATTDTFGVWYAGAKWTIYHENTTINVAAGTRWNVFAPGSGSGAFIDIGSTGNTSGYATQIDNTATNGYGDRVVLVRHDYSADNSYFDHPVGLYASGSGTSLRWNIGNADRAAMPTGAGFNVYAQAPSPNAFRLPAATGATGERIDHPLINGVACAAPQASLVFAPASPAITVDFHVNYDSGSGYWYVSSSAPFPGGTAFNIVIDPAQVFACTDRIFANGFD